MIFELEIENLEANDVQGKILPPGESKYIILNMKNRQKIK